jgi:hypothetical protein
MQEARKRWPELSVCEDATIEALLTFWPEIQVRRASIFEAMVEFVDELEPTREDVLVDVEEEVASTKGAKKLVREKRVATKKRNIAEQETTQGDLWA